MQLYTWLLGNHITPYLGGVQLGKLDTAMVREWRARLLDAGVSASMLAKAYRLLRAVLMTAVREDEILTKNPCRIPGADKEKAAERPVLTMPQVFELAAAVPDRYRAMILLGASASLRWGEVAALQRHDLDTTAGTVRVRRTFSEVRGSGIVLGPPKSRAGLRTVSIPAAIVPKLVAHLDAYTGEAVDAFVFTTENGRPIWRGHFNTLVDWRATVTKLGVPDLNFHDLRHTGNTLAAQTGASLADLMARMGHDSAQAAMVYQHKTSEADRAIADALDAKLKKLGKAKKGGDKPGKKSRQDPDDGAADVVARGGPRMAHGVVAGWR